MTDTNWEQGLDSADPEQRRLAVSTLSMAHGPVAAQLVLRALGDEDWRVRKEAISVVVEMGPSTELLDELIGTFSNSDNVGLRNAVSEALAGFGRPAVRRIAEELSILDADGRKLAAEALGRTGHPSAVTVLSEMLADADANVRVAAIEALGCVGGASTDEVGPMLGASLQSAEVLERLAALDAINALGLVLAWEQLESAVAVPVLERAALIAAARSAAPKAASLLVQALKTQSAFGECWPVLALAEYISQSQASMLLAREALCALTDVERKFLFGLVDSEEAELRAAALIVLAALGDAQASRAVLDATERDELSGVADQLIGAIAGLHPGVLQERLYGNASCQRALILRMSARFPEVIPRPQLLAEVVRTLVTESEPVLSAALEVLATVSDDNCLRTLVERWIAFPASVRRIAVFVLGEMTLRHPEVARAVIDVGSFDGEKWIPVTVMLAALARSGHTTSQRDMELLTRCLLADSAAVRCAALEALSAFGDHAAADAIAFSLADEELEVRLAAVRAIGRLRGDNDSPPVVGRLIELAQKTDDRELLVVAVQAIGETNDPRVLAVLRPLVKSSEPSVAVAAVEAIGQIGDARRLDALIDGLSHPDVDVVKSAMGMLARETDVRVEAHLGACLDHDAWGVRRLAADLLGQRGGDVATGLLRAKHITEREPLVREALERALAVVDGTTPLRRSSPAPREGSWRPR